MKKNSGNFSELVSSTLDNLGYSRDMIQHRRLVYHHAAKTTNQNSFANGQYRLIQAGSKGEGITAYAESDTDHMLELSDVLCSEPAARVGFTMRTTMFELERGNSAPGYSKLRLTRLGNCIYHNNGAFRVVLNSLVQTESGKFISSDGFFQTMVINRMIRNARPKQGPSSPSTLLDIEQDLVYSLRCCCPSVLSKWLGRSRSHEWPAEKTRRTIATLDAHVVPVGFKMSLEKSMEWRICFTLAELALIHSLNDTQTKVYILLKHVSKSVLKPACDAMTSYVMKNIILWACELTPSHLYSNEHLIDRLVQCIILLARFVRKNYLPSYMIPERDLLLGKVSRTQRKQLLGLLGDLIEEGGSMLFRCGRIRHAMLKLYKTPDEATQEGAERNGMERKQLMQTPRLSSMLVTPVVPHTSMMIAVQKRHDFGDEWSGATPRIGALNDVTMTCDATPVCREPPVISDPDELVLWKTGIDVGNATWRRLKKTVATL